MGRSLAACCLRPTAWVLAPLLVAALPIDPAAAATTVGPPVEELVVAPGAEIPIALPAPGLTAEAAIGGGLAAPPSGPLRAPQEEGAHWLALASRDATDNTSPVRWARLVVDGTPPRVVLSVEPQPVPGDGGVRWVTGGAVLTARGEDDLCAVVKTAAGVGERRVEAESDAASLPIGGDKLARRVLTGWAEDAVGNRSGEARIEVMVDPWPPQGRIECSGPCVDAGAERIIASATRLEAHVEDPESGIVRAELQVDGETVGERGWDGPWSEDSYELSVAVTDRAGNAGTVGPVQITVDREGPAISWDLLSATAVAVQASDAAAGVESVEWSTDGEHWLPVYGRVRSRAPEIRLRATDRVGNRSEQVVSLSERGGVR